jgi:hypothetical protein
MKQGLGGASLGAVSSFIIDEKEVNSSQLKYLKSVNEGFLSDFEVQP